MERKIPSEAEFFKMVNTFIEQANTYAEKNLTITSISDCLLYAAARYNVFMVASADNTDNLGAVKKESMKQFKNQYHEYLHEHFRFYEDQEED